LSERRAERRAHDKKKQNRLSKSSLHERHRTVAKHCVATKFLR